MKIHENPASKRPSSQLWLVSWLQKKGRNIPVNSISKLHRNLAFVPALVDVSEPKRPELLVSFWANLPQLWAEKTEFFVHVWTCPWFALITSSQVTLHYHILSQDLKNTTTNNQKTLNPHKGRKWIQMVINIFQDLKFRSHVTEPVMW